MEAWVAVVLFLLFLLSYFLLSFKPKSGGNDHHHKKLPPSPWGLPLLGHLHMLGDLPHRDLHRLAKNYGPIMSIRLGLVPTIVVSSPKAAELFLKTHDAVFASRPKLQIAECVSYGQKNLVYAPYGPYWRNIRKLCTLELFSNSKIEMFRPMRREELVLFVETVKNASVDGSKVNISAMIESVFEDMTYRMVFGFKDDTFNIKSTIKELMELAGTFNMADYIPWLGAFDIQGLGRRMKSVATLLDGFLEKIIDEHVVNAKEHKGQHKDFIDVMLSLMESNNTRELHLDRDHIKAILVDMLAAGMNTSSTATEWVITELVKNPRVMKLVQAELVNTVGLERMVEETDLIKLDYLNMVIKETLRVHSVAPLLAPHESTEDVMVDGYFIPKKTRVIVNAWAIGRDPEVWSDNAEEFYPERFIGSNMDVLGNDLQLIPFGSGRRKCPGMQLGLTVVHLVVAQLVHCFNLKPPDGISPDNLDMTEKFGLTMPRANSLLANPSYRLRIEV
uniref:Cytochrome P450 CYP736A12-like protein n=1 Tax=Nigella sativa TaxID=555479 RepID=A0A7D5Q440_NIGSA|nr:cytochrome P450 CYP736A12-like protein [Nigella sativa]